jgi:RimJ/RimL family protein N-acetyltransferase
MTVPDREAVMEIIRRLKGGLWALPVAFPTAAPDHAQVVLEPVTWRDADDPKTVSLLAAWRGSANAFFPAQFPVTHEGTRRWLVKQLLENPDRVLFWVRAPQGERIGHLGLFRFDFDDGSVELDNVVRGVPAVVGGAMSSAVEALLRWSFAALGMRAVCLRVLSDNARAVRLYERHGFEETMRFPLVRHVEGDVVSWEPAGADYRQPIERYFVTMRLLAPSPNDRHALAGPNFARRTNALSRPSR